MELGDSFGPGAALADTHRGPEHLRTIDPVEAPIDVSIVIPCFNEADNCDNIAASLGPVVRDMARTSILEVVFVDDGSRDATGPGLAALCEAQTSHNTTWRVVTHARNRGLGAAIRTGLAAARGAAIVTTDCDATYRFEEIPRILARLGPGVDMVTASQYHPEGAVANVPAHRLLLSRGSSWLYRRIVGANLWTYTSLFRAYRRPVIEQITFESNGFLAGTELLVKAHLAGFTIAELPTTLYGREIGTSKAKLLRTIGAHLRFLSDVALGRLGDSHARQPVAAGRLATPASSPRSK